MKMNVPKKLALLLFGCSLAAMLLSGGLVYAAAFARGEAGLLTGVLFAFGVLLLGVFSYLIGVTASRRLTLLAERAEQVRRRPALATFDPDGPDDELTALARTIHELRDKLTAGEEARNQLVADVAHELRTPVAIIRGHLETMLAGAEDVKAENLLPLLDETKRMSRLLHDMRDLNLAEAGRLRLDRAWVPLAATLQEIAAIMSIEAETKGAVLALAGDWDGEVYCDAARIKQVLINLIGNAVRYVPEGGEIRVAYGEDNGTVTIEVSDNGPGIPPESLPYLFKRFYRVESSRSRSSGGTGLGLAIAKEYMEAHGGSIRVESRIGEGTVFTLRLPVFPIDH